MAQYVEYSQIEDKWELAHALMRHPSEEMQSKLQLAVPELQVNRKSRPNGLCGGCMEGKLTVERFPPQSQTIILGLLEVVHTNVISPTTIKSKGDAKELPTFVDYYSRYVVAYTTS